MKVVYLDGKSLRGMRSPVTCLRKLTRLTVNRFGLLSLKTNIDEILTWDANFLLTVTILFSLPILTFVQ